MAKRSLDDTLERRPIGKKLSTPFHQAVLANDHEKLEFLLKNSLEFDFNTQDYLGDTVLEIAVFETKDKKMVEILLFATFPKNPEILEMLSEIIAILLSDPKNVDNSNSFGRSALHQAILLNRLDIIECLLKKGININAQDKNGQTPAHYATIMNSLPVVELFRYYYHQNRKDSIVLNLANPITVKDSNKRMCHHLAMIHGHLEIFTFTIKNFPLSFIAKDKLDNNVFHLAATNAKSCKFLLEEKNKFGYKEDFIIKMLNSKNLLGQYPIDVAISVNNLESCEILFNVSEAILESSNYDNFIYYYVQKNISESLKIVAQHKELKSDRNFSQFLSDKIVNLLRTLDIPQKKPLLIQLSKSENFLKFVETSIKCQDKSVSNYTEDLLIFEIVNLINNFWQNYPTFYSSETSKIFCDLFLKEIILPTKDGIIMHQASNLQSQCLAVTSCFIPNSASKSRGKE